MISLKFAFIIILLLLNLLHICNSQQLQEKKKVVVDIDKSLTNFLVKFYKHRLVAGQNTAIAPLLDLYVLVLLYEASDASAKTDIHTLLGIPKDAEDDTVAKFEAKIRLYLESFGGAKFDSKLFVNSSIRANATELVRKKFFSVSPVNFGLKKDFQREIKTWLQSKGISNSNHVVHNFNVDDKTVALILQMMSYRWKLPLKLSTSTEAFQREPVKYLKGTLKGSYAKIDKLGVEVLEQTNSKLKLWLILPNSMVTFVNKTIVKNTLNSIAKSLEKKQFVKVSIPRINIEYNSEENAFIQNNFHVLTSIFSSPSIKFESNKESRYSIKGILMHCDFQFIEDGSAKVAKEGTEIVKFNKPFTLMVLTKDTNIPLLMANYFTVKDKMLGMEDEEQILAAQVAEELERNKEL